MSMTGNHPTRGFAARWLTRLGLVFVSACSCPALIVGDGAALYIDVRLSALTHPPLSSCTRCSWSRSWPSTNCIFYLCYCA